MGTLKLTRAFNSKSQGVSINNIPRRSPLLITNRVPRMMALHLRFILHKMNDDGRIKVIMLELDNKKIEKQASSSSRMPPAV